MKLPSIRLSEKFEVLKILNGNAEIIKEKVDCKITDYLTVILTVFDTAL